MGNIKPWVVDASHITDISKGSPSVLHTTNKIAEFLENPTKNFISATKGIGKTFLLKIKSHQIRTTSSGLFIPKVDLVDKIGSSKPKDLTKDVYGQYHKVEMHELLWHYAFLLTIIRNSQELIDDINQKKVEYPSGLIFANADYPVVKTVYLALLDDYNLFKSLRDGHFFESFEVSIRNFNKSTYIFIDNVDEFYNNKEGTYYEELWFTAQIALLKSVVKLTDDYKHLHIYGTMRKRALDEFKRTQDEMYAQVMDSVVELTYTKEDLKKIFINNIQAEKPERLKNTDKQLLKENPIKAFIGFDIIVNRFVSNDSKEDVWDYIYRHTLGRPRDLMRMGDKISLMDNNQRNVEQIRNTINEVALENGQQYLNEINRFILIDLEEDIYKRVNKNILTFEELQKICCTVNHESLKDCISCTKRHVFCTLYSYGLLGYEYNDNPNKKCQQSFVVAGKQPTFDMKNTLPNASRYFVHPCLSEVIDHYRKEKHIESFEYSKEIIVGYDGKLKCTKIYTLPTMVEISNELEIGKYPITYQEYLFYCDIAEKPYPKGEYTTQDRKPLIFITYQEALDYCAWLGEETGDIYRLPTVSEWEQCCNTSEERAEASIWHRGNSQGTTQTVDSKEPNDLGIHDMIGNVWEWCSDDYKDDTVKNHKYLKGGSYRDYIGTLNCKTTGSADKDKSAPDIGFRVVKERVVHRMD